MEEIGVAYRFSRQMDRALLSGTRSEAEQILILDDFATRKAQFEAEEGKQVNLNVYRIIAAETIAEDQHRLDRWREAQSNGMATEPPMELVRDLDFQRRLVSIIDHDIQVQTFHMQPSAVSQEIKPLSE